MMRKLIAVAALMASAVAIPAAYAASTFEYGKENSGFYYDAPNPQFLAGLVEKSIGLDNSGNGLLAEAAGDPGKCRRDGSCATPNWIFQRLRAIDPEEGPKSLSEVAGYLRELVSEPARPGPYYSDCGKWDGKRYVVAADCFQRAFHPGERAWVHKKSKRVVFLGHCANTTRGPAPLPATVKVPAAPPSRFIGSRCPDFRFVANAWRLSTFPEGLRQEAEALIKEAEARDSQHGVNLNAYKGDAFSRTIGPRARKEVKVRAPSEVELRVRYVEQSGRVLQELGVLKLTNGEGTFTFPDDPRQKIVEVAWPKEAFRSPTVSADERRLRLFPSEWGDWCALHVHGIVRE